MLWKVRCLIALLFRVLGLAVVAWVYWQLWLYRHEPPLEQVLSDLAGNNPAGAAVFLPMLLVVPVELLGRLLSWTKPSWALPRFSRGN